MTAAEVPRDAILILRESYDSREGFCGLLRIRTEAFKRLRSNGLMPENAGYGMKMQEQGPIGVVTISIQDLGKKFYCQALMQPVAECELLIYEQSVKQRPGI